MTLAHLHIIMCKFLRYISNLTFSAFGLSILNTEFLRLNTHNYDKENLFCTDTGIFISNFFLMCYHLAVYVDQSDVETQN